MDIQPVGNDPGVEVVMCAKMDQKPTTAMVHYSSPPVIGGVEGVIEAHCQVFNQFNFPTAVIAGRGDQNSLPGSTDFHLIPEMDSQHPDVLEISAALEKGVIPDTFEPFTEKLVKILDPIVSRYDNLIVHNIFTKHFNIPLTAALFRLLERKVIQNCIAWCHDFTWTSSNSRSKVHDGYPWDLLRQFNANIAYVTVSKDRQKTLAELFHQSKETIKVIYNGVDLRTLLGISREGYALIDRLGLIKSDLILLMPVRVTQAKNIEFALNLLSFLKSRGINVKLVLSGPPDPHSENSMNYFNSLQTRRNDLDLDDVMHFVYESSQEPNQPYEIGLGVVGDLYRISDMLLMPSHREGFGMPVLEAGLVGIPVICSSNVPAALEIGDNDVQIFDTSMDPSQLAEELVIWMGSNPQYRLRRRVRRTYTWEALFEEEILPIIIKDHEFIS